MISGHLLDDENGLLRFSAICARIKKEGDDPQKFIDTVNEIGRTCPTHGYLKDPIIGVVANRNQIAVGCPDCSGSEVRKVWESQALLGIES